MNILSQFNIHTSKNLLNLVRAFLLINSLWPTSIDSIISWINDYSEVVLSSYIYFPFHMLIIATRLSAVSSLVRWFMWYMLAVISFVDRFKWASSVLLGNIKHPKKRERKWRLSNQQLIFNRTKRFFDVFNTR